MQDVIFVAIGGAFGAVSRYGSNLAAAWLFGANFPYGTLIVNVIGCLLLGLAMGGEALPDWLPRYAKLAVTVGFLGAFTTFSTFGHDTIRQIDQGSWHLALINIAAQLGLGLSAAWLGFVTARALTT